MSQCSNDPRVADLFTRGSHHRGISVLYLTQNLFPPGKLLIDCHQLTPENLRLRTNILSGERQIVYVKST